MDIGYRARMCFKGMLNPVESRQMFICGTYNSRRQYGMDTRDHYKWLRNVDTGGAPGGDKNVQWKDAWNVYPPRAAVVYCEHFDGDVLFISADTMWWYMLDVDMFYAIGLGQRVRSVEFITSLHCVDGVYWEKYDETRYQVCPVFVGSKENLERFFSEFLNQYMFKTRAKLINDLRYRRFLKRSFMDVEKDEKVTPPYNIAPVDYRPSTMVMCRDHVFPNQKLMYKGKSYIEEYDISNLDISEPVVIHSYGNVLKIDVLDREYKGCPRKFIMECTAPPQKIVFHIPPHPDNEGYMLDFTIRLKGKRPDVAYSRDCMVEFDRVYTTVNYYGDKSKICRRVFSRIAVEGNNQFPLCLQVRGYPEDAHFGACVHISSGRCRKKDVFMENMEMLKKINGGWDGCVVDWFGEEFSLHKE